MCDDRERPRPARRDPTLWNGTGYTGGGDGSTMGPPAKIPSGSVAPSPTSEPAKKAS